MSIQSEFAFKSHTSCEYNQYDICFSKTICSEDLGKMTIQSKFAYKTPKCCVGNYYLFEKQQHANSV